MGEKERGSLVCCFQFSARVCACVTAINGLQVHRIGIITLGSQQAVIIGLFYFILCFLKLYKHP